MKTTKQLCPGCDTELPPLDGRKRCPWCGCRVMATPEGFALAACPPIETKAELEKRKLAVGEAMRHG